MAFPNFRNKHANDSIFSPVDFLDYQRKIGNYLDLNLPESMILCYSTRLLAYVKKQYKATGEKRFSPVRCI
jgi:hypothetical protein